MTQAVAPHAAEANFWKERRARGPSSRLAALPPALALPPAARHDFRAPASSLSGTAATLAAIAAIGSPRRVTGPQNGRAPLVYHLQDVHHHDEAQRNLAALLETIAETEPVAFVGLEASFGEIDLRPWRAHADQAAVRAIGTHLLSRHGLTGPALSLLTSVPAPAVGIDDEALYLRHVKAVREGTALQAGHQARVAALQSRLAAESAATFGPALRRFDARAARFHADGANLGDYVRAVARHARPTSAVASFLEALALEDGLDFSRAEAERAAVLARLLDRVDSGRRDALLRDAVDLQLGRLRYADFYRRLASHCESAGIRLSAFPAFHAYVRYAALADSIDADRLFHDLRRHETEAYRALTRTDGERKLVDQIRAARAFEKIAAFALTPAEWAAFAAGRAVPAELADLDWAPFIDFYRMAEARDAAMAARVGDALVRTDAKKAVIVTGGFHAAGLGRRLAERGIRMISIAPRLTRVDGKNGAGYLSAFAREKAPLERLFIGEKLFLGTPPFQALHFEGAAAAAALAGRRANAVIESLSGRPELAATDTGPASARIRNEATGDALDVSVRRDGETITDIAAAPAPSASAGFSLRPWRALFGLVADRGWFVTVAVPLLELPILALFASTVLFIPQAWAFRVTAVAFSLLHALLELNWSDQSNPSWLARGDTWSALIGRAVVRSFATWGVVEASYALSVPFVDAGVPGFGMAAFAFGLYAFHLVWNGLMTLLSVLAERMEWEHVAAALRSVRLSAGESGDPFDALERLYPGAMSDPLVVRSAADVDALLTVAAHLDAYGASVRNKFIADTATISSAALAAAVGETEDEWRVLRDRLVPVLSAGDVTSSWMIDFALRILPAIPHDGEAARYTLSLVEAGADADALVAALSEPGSRGASPIQRIRGHLSPAERETLADHLLRDISLDDYTPEELTEAGETMAFILSETGNREIADTLLRATDWEGAIEDALLAYYAGENGPPSDVGGRRLVAALQASTAHSTRLEQLVALVAGNLSRFTEAAVAETASLALAAVHHRPPSARLELINIIQELAMSTGDGFRLNPMPDWNVWAHLDRWSTDDLRSLRHMLIESHERRVWDRRLRNAELVRGSQPAVDLLAATLVFDNDAYFALADRLGPAFPLLISAIAAMPGDRALHSLETILRDVDRLERLLLVSNTDWETQVIGIQSILSAFSRLPNIAAQSLDLRAIALAINNGSATDPSFDGFVLALLREAVRWALDEPDSNGAQIVVRESLRLINDRFPFPYPDWESDSDESILIRHILNDVDTRYALALAISLAGAPGAAAAVYVLDAAATEDMDHPHPPSADLQRRLVRNIDPRPAASFGTMIRAGLGGGTLSFDHPDIAERFLAVRNLVVIDLWEEETTPWETLAGALLARLDDTDFRHGNRDAHGSGVHRVLEMMEANPGFAAALRTAAGLDDLHLADAGPRLRDRLDRLTWMGASPLADAVGADIELALPYLNHSDPDVRRAASWAVAVLTETLIGDGRMDDRVAGLVFRTALDALLAELARRRRDARDPKITRIGLDDVPEDVEILGRVALFLLQSLYGTAAGQREHHPFHAAALRRALVAAGSRLAPRAAGDFRPFLEVLDASAERPSLPDDLSGGAAPFSALRGALSDVRYALLSATDEANPDLILDRLTWDHIRETIEPAGDAAAGGATLSLPIWRALFGPVADRDWFVTVVVPLLELPIIALFASTVLFVSQAWAFPIASVAFSLLHTVLELNWTDRTNPSWLARGDTWGALIGRAIVRAFATWGILEGSYALSAPFLDAGFLGTGIGAFAFGLYAFHLVWNELLTLLARGADRVGWSGVGAALRGVRLNLDPGDHALTLDEMSVLRPTDDRRPADLLGPSRDTRRVGDAIVSAALFHLGKRDEPSAANLFSAAVDRNIGLIFLDRAPAAFAPVRIDALTRDIERRLGDETRAGRIDFASAFGAAEVIGSWIGREITPADLVANKRLKIVIGGPDAASQIKAVERLLKRHGTQKDVALIAEPGTDAQALRRLRESHPKSITLLLSDRPLRRDGATALDRDALEGLLASSFDAANLRDSVLVLPDEATIAGLETGLEPSSPLFLLEWARLGDLLRSTPIRVLPLKSLIGLARAIATQA